MRFAVALLGAAVLCTPGARTAAAEGSASPIIACVHTVNGHLRIVDDESVCRPNERPLIWRQQGPPGPPSAGARVFLTSSEAVAALEGAPAVVVPGLRAEVSIAENSSLAVQVDARDHTDCPQFRCCTSGTLMVTVDGQAVVSRYMAGFHGGNSGAPEDYGITWLSHPLAAGSYTVALELAANEDPNSSLESTNCVGSGGGADDQFEARVSIIELRQ